MPAHNWSDDVDENGIKTVTEIKTNENGEKVKVTKKIQLKTQTKQVNHAVAERRVTLINQRNGKSLELAKDFLLDRIQNQQPLEKG